MLFFYLYKTNSSAHVKLFSVILTLTSQNRTEKCSVGLTDVFGVITDKDNYFPIKFHSQFY